MSTQLRVVSLQAQNILRLSAIDIKWSADKSILTLGGANGAGKSSAVNCVAMALGGKELCPQEPIKRGESHGFVELNLGDLRIRRDFTREELPCNCGAAEAAKEIKDPALTVVHEKSCTLGTFGEVKSRLVVRNADGITQGTPQAILDKLIGKMTFDPMAFVNMDPKPQEDVLRRIVNLDVSQFELTRKTAFERRAVFNKQHKDALAVLSSMPTYDDAPAQETSFDEITNELRRAEELRQAAQNADIALARARGSLTATQQSRDGQQKAVERIERELTQARADLERLTRQAADEDVQLNILEANAEKAKSSVPDVQAINQKLKDVEKSNEHVRANRAYRKADDDAKAILLQAAKEDGVINEAETAKRAALDAAQFPVPGLSLSDNGVTFNDIPFKQASTAEQIRVSVAIGFALHPKLKLLCVKNGNALDDDSLQLIANEASAAGGQILMEYVTKDAADVSVFIEDGHQA